jgi:hypothetical protein
MTGPSSLNLFIIVNSGSVDRRDPDAAAIAFAAVQHNTADAALQYRLCGCGIDGTPKSFWSPLFGRH